MKCYPASGPAHESGPTEPLMETAADLCGPLIAIAIYAIGFAGLMLLLNPFNLAEGSEWLLWLPQVARQILETIF